MREAELLGSAAGELTPPSVLSALYSGGKGFAAFESALLVPPLSVSIALHDQGLLSWVVRGEEFCFAYDLFGSPFVIGSDGAVARVDPETGERHVHSETLEAWAALVMKNPNHELGHRLAVAWNAAHRRPVGLNRLLPVKPFVMGGEYQVENLRLCSLERAMLLYKELSGQLANVPDGQSTAVSGWEPSFWTVGRCGADEA